MLEIQQLRTVITERQEINEMRLMIALPYYLERLIMQGEETQERLSDLSDLSTLSWKSREVRMARGLRAGCGRNKLPRERASEPCRITHLNIS